MATNNTSNTPSEINTVWDINTDIYDIAGTINGVKSRYIEDIDEDTLSLGIFGFISDIESKKIQTATIMSAQLGNELFPARAKLTKNILAHAIYNNITNINAVPAIMTINIGIKLSDLEAYIDDDRFIFDANCPIFIEDIEFHFEYDIILSRTLASSPSGTAYTYSAHYDMTNKNRVSSITDPYLKQPFLIKMMNEDYVVFQANIRQYTIEETSDKIISDSVIENKTFTFEFSNQLADFDVYVTTEGMTTRVTPILYGGEMLDNDEEKYCWYLFISDNTVRITFDSASFSPGLNSDILVRAYTTLGASGNFEYKKYDTDEGGLYVDIESEKYNYDRIQCLAFLVTDSHYGEDRKSKEELQKLIPKMAHSRAGITTEQDVLDYFNLISTETNRLVMKKKVDNQFARTWYAYFLLKDENNNVLPSNTINLLLKVDNDPEHPSGGDPGVFVGEDGRYVLPAGAILKLSDDGTYATVIDESDPSQMPPDPYTPEYYAAGYFYTTLHNIMITRDPLYTAFYMTATNKDRLFSFEWINEKSELQFVANKANFKRSLLTEMKKYIITYNLAQSISSDYGIHFDPATGESNMKCVLIMYKSGSPYRWIEGKMYEYDDTRYLSRWKIELETDNGFDINNDIKITNVYTAGSEHELLYGYFPSVTQCDLYVLAELPDGEELGRYNLDQLAPGFDGYTVTNVYHIDKGINFYDNYTNILNARTTSPFQDEGTTTFLIEGIPVAGEHYMVDPDMSDYFINKIDEKKDYIIGCLARLENNMEIDFKFFNTYGPSLTYTVDQEGEIGIGHIDMDMDFKLKLKSSSDIYTKDEIIKFVKNYIENLEKIGDLHIPNLITDITNEFSTRIVYIEFVSFNGFPLGIQHALIKETEIDTIPEFINIRNLMLESGSFVPAINIELVN